MITSYLRLMKLLLQSGANPAAQVSRNKGGNKLPALGIIKLWAPFSTKLVDALLSELQRSIPPAGSEKISQEIAIIVKPTHANNRQELEVEIDDQGPPLPLDWASNDRR